MNAMDDTTLLEGVRRLGLALNEQQRRAFSLYYALLVERNEAAGLTTVIDPFGVQRRHFLESLALIPALAEHGILLRAGTRLIDVGSGAGFPGLPLAIAIEGLQVTLLESHGRKAAFLRDVTLALGLAERVRVLQMRAEDAARLPDEREAYDGAVARAVAALPVLAELALPFVRVGGWLAAIKGSRAEEEISQAGGALTRLGGGLPSLLPLSAGEGEHRLVLVVVPKNATTPERFPRRAGVPERRPLESGS